MVRKTVDGKFCAKDGTYKPLSETQTVTLQRTENGLWTCVEYLVRGIERGKPCVVKELSRTPGDTKYNTLDRMFDIVVRGLQK